MSRQRRTVVAASPWVLMAFVNLATGCSGGFENSLSGLGSGSECTRVKTGEWEFELSTGGQVFLSFVEGDLTQSGCLLSYDEDRVFEGDLTGSIWNVSSEPGGFSFVGSFSGSPATSFSGTFRDSENVPAAIAGRYVGR